jgi:S1-C subfamily serine protease
VRDASDAVFTPSSTVEARYQIAAIVHALQYEYRLVRDSSHYVDVSEDTSGTATLEVEFQLFDAVEKQTVSKIRVPGYGFERGRSPAPIPKALVSALRHALADATFVAPLLRGAKPAPPAAVAQAIAVTRCDSTPPLPNGLVRAQDAVVAVVAGAANGTGAVVSADGYVLTAAHLVGTQKSVLLRFKSGLELPAEVVRVDAGRDTALLKAPGRGFACLRTEPTSPAVGTEIWAIGNPLSDELARSVTRGVVSGNQTVQNRSYLQTDAAVNPGSSGGPLLDASGAVRGIVIEKVWVPGVEGLGFAVPIADAERVLGISWK